MPLRFDEYYAGYTGLTVGIKRTLYSERSDYQLIEVVETDSWGKMLMLDGMVMLSEGDEFVYHEMIAHPALAIHPRPERVLIIGGGDGGTAREVLRHESVAHVDMVEIDGKVIEVSKRFFPDIHNFNDSRLSVTEADGKAFLEESEARYDVIIVDGSDPVGPAKVLFCSPFFRECYRHLSENGFFITQSESPWVPEYQKVISDMYQSLGDIFPVVRPYLCYIPLYPTGMWSMMMAARQIDPRSSVARKRVEEWYERHKSNLKYFNRDIFSSAFALPGFVADLLKESK